MGPSARDKRQGGAPQEDEEIVTNSVTLRSANRPELVEVLGEYRNLHGPRLFRGLSWRVTISLTGWWEYLIAGKGPRNGSR